MSENQHALDLDLTAWKKKLRLKKDGDKPYVFDPIRKKWMILQPEEVVRQLMVQYLIEEKGYSKNRIWVEQGLQVLDVKKRLDIIVYGDDHQPLIIVECKSPKVAINQEVFHQIANYNLPLRVPYLVVTNGPCTFCCSMSYADNQYQFLEMIPDKT